MLIAPEVPKIFTINQHSWLHLKQQCRFIADAQLMSNELSVDNSFHLFLRNKQYLTELAEQHQINNFALPFHFFDLGMEPSEIEPFLIFIEGTETLVEQCHLWETKGNDMLGELAALIIELSTEMVNDISRMEKRAVERIEVGSRQSEVDFFSSPELIQYMLSKINDLSRELSTQISALIHGLNSLNSFVNRQLSPVCHDLLMGQYTEESFIQFGNSTLDIEFALKVFEKELQALIQATRNMSGGTELPQFSLRRLHARWAHLLESVRDFQPFVDLQKSYANYSVL